MTPIEVIESLLSTLTDDERRGLAAKLGAAVPPAHPCAMRGHVYRQLRRQRARGFFESLFASESATHVCERCGDSIAR